MNNFRVTNQLSPTFRVSPSFYTTMPNLLVAVLKPEITFASFHVWRVAIERACLTCFTNEDFTLPI